MRSQASMIDPGIAIAEGFDDFSANRISLGIDFRTFTAVGLVGLAACGTAANSMQNSDALPAVSRIDAPAVITDGAPELEAEVDLGLSQATRGPQIQIEMPEEFQQEIDALAAPEDTTTTTAPTTTTIATTTTTAVTTTTSPPATTTTSPAPTTTVRPTTTTTSTTTTTTPPPLTGISGGINEAATVNSVAVRGTSGGVTTTSVPASGEQNVTVVDDCDRYSPGDGVQFRTVRVRHVENEPVYNFDGSLLDSGELRLGSGLVSIVYADGSRRQVPLDYDFDVAINQWVGNTIISRQNDAEYANGTSDQPNPSSFTVNATRSNGQTFSKSVTGLSFPNCNDLNPGEAREQVRTVHNF